jgi:hypothetical protein
MLLAVPPPLLRHLRQRADGIESGIKRKKARDTRIGASRVHLMLPRPLPDCDRRSAFL